jgi:AcrR family transcriptional regulator
MYVLFLTMKTQSPTNLNDARSRATRARLIGASIDSMIECGFSKTTGVEICRRAGVTRGALNHHFPVYSDLLIAALHQVYSTLQTEPDATSLEGIVRSSYNNVIQPAFKVVIELWLASQNDPDIGTELASAISDSSSAFSPKSLRRSNINEPATDAIYYTLFELLIAIGLGRATSGGKASAHEHMVFETMLNLAQQQDSRGVNNNE